MKITKAAALVWLFASIPSFGAVEATLFHITTNETFTVPAGKVLIIENYMRAGTSFNVTHRIEKGTNSFILNFDDGREFGVMVDVHTALDFGLVLVLQPHFPKSSPHEQPIGTSHLSE